MATTPGILGRMGNGVYKVAHFFTGYLNVPPNKHRLYNAIGLTVGIVGGRWGMNILVGEKPSGEKIDRADVPLPLRPLHGIFAYDHHSDDPVHRWFKVIDMTVPAVLGGIGAGMGSDIFFKPSLDKVRTSIATGKVHSLADAESQVMYHQGRVWGFFSKLSSVFGSASGFGLIPSWLNYSSTLGAKFTFDFERSAVMRWFGEKLRKELINSTYDLPVGPMKAVGEVTEQLTHNAAKIPRNAEQTITGILQSRFASATEAQVETFKSNLLKIAHDIRTNGAKHGDTLEKIEAEIHKQVGKQLSTTDGSFERSLIHAGIDPRTARIGDNSALSTFARWLGIGTTKRIKGVQENLIKYVNEHHGKMGVTMEGTGRHTTFLHKFGERPKDLPDLTESTTGAKIVTGAFIGTGVATLGAIATAKDASVKDLPGYKKNTAPQAAPTSTEPASGEGSDKSFSKQIGKRQHVVHSRKDRGFVNGKVLDTAEGVTGMFNAGIGLHRVHCAVGLWLGSWFGDEVMKTLTGVTFQGRQVKDTEIWKPLRKIYKVLPFNPYSELPKDKWMQVLRWGVPGIIGGMAVMQGSKIFFENRTRKLKKAVYLDEVEDKATMAQSQPWSYTSAITSLLGFPTGFPMLPLVNYSTNLGTRFSMASGRKVAMPIVGKWWSNNSTLFPFGPPGMINELIKEAVNNKSYDPELLETYAIGVLKPWYDNVTPHQVESFVMKVHETRDKFFKEGGVPDQMKKDLEKELNEHLHGAGLHETLKEVGLDPLKAHLANNGLSGTIANILGARGEVQKITKDFVETHTERLRQKQQSPDSSPTLST